MSAVQPYTLITSRLLLRELRPSDAEGKAAHALWGDPDVVRYMSFPPMTPEQAAEHVQSLAAANGQHPRRDYHFALVPCENAGNGADDALIGWCALRVHDMSNREANIGYAVRRDEWGKGYTTEAAHALVAFGFNTLGLHRICARCVPENLASVRVIEKIGMQREGHKRKQRWIKGEWWDSLEHSIVDEAWQSRTAAP